MIQAKAEGLRVYYTAGPGNAFATFRDWLADRDDVATSHVAYSRQFYEACARHGAAARVACSFVDDTKRAEGRGIELLFQPDLSLGLSGGAFQHGQWRKARQHIAAARAFKANVVVLSEDAIPALYAPLQRQGVTLVQSLHTMIWGKNPSLMQRLRHFGYRHAYRRGIGAVLSASDAVSAQVRHLASGRDCPIVEFLPLYQPSYFGTLPPPDLQAERLDLAFIGRVEVNKGALDLVEIATRLRDRGLSFRLHICGIGGALPQMQALVAARDLGTAVVFHGWCARAKLTEVLRLCQLTLVPTRAEISEGFNHVVVESVLAGRPAIASDVCPAVGYVGEAALSVAADDPQAFADAVATLADDRAELARRALACKAAAARFFDPGHSYGAALDRVFEAVLQGQKVKGRVIPAQA